VLILHRENFRNTAIAFEQLKQLVALIAPSQKKVVDAIADKGSGIPPEVQQRIFDPLSITTPIGKGTGRGMSISYQIVTKKHGGTLACSSTLGEGTEFTIALPI